MASAIQIRWVDHCLCCFVLSIVVLAFGCTSSEESSNGQPGSTSEEVSTSTAQFSLDESFEPQAETNDEAERIGRIMVSEELIRNLSPRLGQIGKQWMGQPSISETFFADEASYAGLQDVDWKVELAAENKAETTPDSSETNHAKFDHPLVGHFHWPIAEPVRVGDLATVLWKPLVQSGPLEECQFGIEAGELSATGNQFRMHSLFEGKLMDGEKPIGVKAKQTIDWAKFDDDWRIVRWHQTKFDLVTSKLAPRPLFENVTEQAIPDVAVFDSVNKSSLEEIVGRKIEDNTLLNPISQNYIRFTDWESAYQYPAVSIVDFDRDGWDDIFLLDRHASMGDEDPAPVPPSILLKNRGDGKFEDVSEASGLQISKYGNCAIFADFDNDGDKDVFVGRTLEPSQYFVNEAGKFRLDPAMTEALKLTHFVVSASVIDVNRDGMLDLYLNTYISEYQDWFDEYFDPDDLLPMRLKAKSHRYIDRSGPANVLLMNKGGRLEPVKIDEALKQWRNSYQSVWSDFDGDGDSDLYICNDFAPDAFLRNDTKRGSFEAKFSDVSAEIVNNGTMGFGMGATWGDYDRDGDLDLYVSNMYSKAGKRIVKQAGKVDARTKVATQGNFLYQRNGDKFDQIAGLGESEIHVSKVGWSFGGQFADFDNDGLLDLYVPSGFFSAPESIRAEVDL